MDQNCQLWLLYVYKNDVFQSVLVLLLGYYSRCINKLQLWPNAAEFSSEPKIDHVTFILSEWAHPTVAAFWSIMIHHFYYDQKVQAHYQDIVVLGGFPKFS